MIGQTNAVNSGFVYKLGTGSSFDIKKLLPELDYTKLTVNNFIVQPTKINVSGRSSAGNGNSEGNVNLGGSTSASGSNSTTITKKYSNGVFSVSNTSVSKSYSNSIDDGKLNTSGECSGSVGNIQVYLVTSKIKTV